MPVGEGASPSGCEDPAYEHDFSASVPTGRTNGVKPVEMYKLSSLINSHKPVAVTQGKNVLLIKSEDESAIKTYQDQVNPKLNPDFFAELKKFSDSQKSLSL
ncbi:hypothetical protein FAI40_04590 [Acetobacteraceae bacterium]|nr:hypothetical protein FAI40_04590 [Acetobacteraceae bacterium]